MLIHGISIFFNLLPYICQMLRNFKYILFVFIFFQTLLVFAQITPKDLGKVNAQRSGFDNDSILNRNNKNRPSDSLKIFNPTIGDYNFWTNNIPKQALDTILTIDNFYSKNIYRRDLFEFQQFSNLGQSLNPLTPCQTGDNLQLLPTGKSFMYVKEEDVKYYDVKTPTTEFILENGYKEGQFLSTTFTHNIHSRLNYAINYTYLKSQGRYLNTLANNSNIIISSNYRTKNNRYQLQANFVTHDMDNQENAGISSESVIAFVENDENFSNRDRMQPNLSSAQTRFDERRYHIDHKFGILSFSKKKDSLSTKDFPIYIKHALDYKHQAFDYQEPTAESYFSSQTIYDSRNNRKKFNKLQNTVSLGYRWSDKLQLEGGIVHQIIKPYYEDSYFYIGGAVPQYTRESRFGVQGKLDFQWKENLVLNGTGFFTTGEIFGNQYHLDANIKTIAFKDYILHGGLKLNSSFPSLHFYMNQSFYNDFNYFNPSFKNQTSQELFANLTSKKLGLTLSGALLNQNNLVYINTNYLPQQLDGAVNYFKVGAREHHKFGQFGLDVQAQYQKILENSTFYPIPDMIARATIYYDRWAFSNNAHIQTGLTGRYFSKFNSREFNPVLNEFMLLENGREIGNYPQIDLFFNIKVNRMRIYLRGENLNSFFMRGEYFSTPNQPARDFKIQVGIHWFLFS